jgi:hypothetical protein
VTPRKSATLRPGRKRCTIVLCTEAMFAPAACGIDECLIELRRIGSDETIPAGDFRLIPNTLLPALLIVQGVIGGIDTLLNHELFERLPRRFEARNELGLHAMREALYAALFGGLAWFAWHGTWAAIVGALLVAEVMVDACDEFMENRIRILPQNERVLHFFLTLNLGLIIAVLTPTLFSWARHPSALVPVDHGALSWALTALALSATAWSFRDLIAWRTLSRRRT